MANNKKLRKRLNNYVKNVEQALEKSDSLDSAYFRGYDQALHNVTWALKRMLEDTK